MTAVVTRADVAGAGVPAAGTGRAAAAWLRVDLRRRWRSMAALALLVAVSAAVVFSALAGARRGASALTRLAERTTPATVVVMPFTPDFDWAAVAALPEVEALTTLVDTDFDVVGLPSDDLTDDLAVAGPPADTNAFRTTEVPVVLAGRLPDPSRADEAVVTPRFVDSYHLGVGDTVTAVLPTVSQATDDRSIHGPAGAGPRQPIHIVGVVRSPFYSDVPVSRGSLIASPGLLAAYRPNLINGLNWRDALVRLRGGAAAVPAFTDHLAALTGRTDISVRNLADEGDHRQRADAFEARWLLAFGLAALVAAVVLVGPALTRYVGAGTADLRVLRALGMTRRETTVAAMAGPVLAAVVGVLVGVGAAVLASRWFPIGSAAAVEPSPGMSADWLVLGAGAAAVVLVAGVGAWLAARVTPAGAGARRGSRVARAAAGARLPVPVVVGTRYALEPGRGRAALPVRPALSGAVAGVLGVVAAFTLSAAVSDAAEHPTRFGQTWQLETWLGFNGVPFGPGDPLRTVATDPDVAAVNDWRAAVVTEPRTRTEPILYSYSPIGTGVATVLTEGRMPTAASEVVLGPDTADRIDAHVGDTVTFTAPPGRSVRLTVTGIGFVPAGSHCTSCTEAAGGWVTDAGFDRVFPTYRFHGGFVAVRPGADVATVAARLKAATGVDFAPPYQPFAAAEIRQVRRLPAALGVFLALLALGAVGHTLTTAVRRRRHELAVLRALGMTRWQARGILLTQAGTLALVGLAFGVPLGLALGRTVWRIVADATPVYYRPPFAPVALASTVLVALLLAALLAAWPGTRAARLRLADVLRAE
jgi:ABC-type lipoprotein release transport system permease subunit